MNDLLPCPFCGSKPLPAKHDHARMYVIRCLNCNVELWDTNDGWGELQFVQMFNSAWNRRALPAVQPVTVRLVFSNADATPKTTVLDVSAASVPDIMAWYGAYCAGDRYTVTVDGRNVPMDQNGEPVHVNETPKREHVPGDVLTPATKGGAHD